MTDASDSRYVERKIPTRLNSAKFHGGRTVNTFFAYTVHKTPDPDMSIAKKCSLFQDDVSDTLTSLDLKLSEAFVRSFLHSCHLDYIIHLWNDSR